MPNQKKKTKSKESNQIDLILKWRDDPLEFVKDVIQPEIIRDEQVQIMHAVRYNQRVAIRSGHGIGKTASVAWTCLWFLFTRPDAMILATAPTKHQLSDTLWPEIGKWMNGRKAIESAFEWTKSRVQARGYEDLWFASAVTANKPENIAGKHADHLLILVDEASGVDEGIFQAIEGSLTGKDNKLVMIGNPTKTSGSFHRSFHADRTLYKCLHFSSLESKNVSRSYIDRMRRYGEDSDIWKVRVLGEFPSGEPNTFIPLWMAEGAVGRDPVTRGKLIIGVDPARFGDDESIVCSVSGDYVYQMTNFRGIDTSRLTAETLRICREHRSNGYEGTIEIRVDDTGIGGGVTDQLRQYEDIESLKIIACNFGGSSTNQDYANFGAQMWGEVKRRINDLCLPKDEELTAQLTTRKYSLDKNGRLILERKEDMKKRGLPSPDRADALALALAPVSRSSLIELNAPVESTRRENDVLGAIRESSKRRAQGDRTSYDENMPLYIGRKIDR